MLCVEDYLDTLEWAKSIGSLDGLMNRADDNFDVLDEWIAKTEWVEFLAKDPATRSNTSVCLSIVDPEISRLEESEQRAFVKRMTSLLEQKNAALDIGGYRDAPPGLRIWTGGTVEADDVKALIPWLEWAFQQAKSA